MGSMKMAGKVFGITFVTLVVVPTFVAYLLWLADGDARGGFDDAMIMSVRYPVSVIIFLLLLIPFFWAVDNRKPGTSLTWGEAMVAATYVFFLLFWIYGVVPHEFLNWADSELAWRPDKKLIGPEGSWVSWWSFWGDIPLTIHKETIRDILAVVIYGFGLGGFMWAAGYWNNREQRAAEADAIEPVSSYGRPLVSKAKG